MRGMTCSHIITATTTLLQTKIRRQHKNLDSRYKCINTCTEIKKIFWGFRKSQVAVNISHEQLCGLLLCPAELHLPRSTGKVQGAEALWHAGGTRVDVGNHQDLTRGGGLNSEKNRGAHTRQQWRMATIAVDKKTFFSLPEYEWEMTGTKKISFLHYALHFRGGGAPFQGVSIFNSENQSHFKNQAATPEPCLGGLLISGRPKQRNPLSHRFAPASYVGELILKPPTTNHQAFIHSS